MQSNLHSLVNRFVADFRDRLTIEHPGETHVERSAPGQYGSAPGVSPGLRMAYYGVYILTCMMVMLNCGLRRQIN